MSENAQPVFSIEKLYVKDLSLEVPNAPQIYLEREAPQINVQLRTEGNGIDEGVFEVTPDRHRHRPAARRQDRLPGRSRPSAASSRSATCRRKTWNRS